MSTFLVFSLLMLLASSASAQYQIKTLYTDSSCSGSPTTLAVTPMASGCTAHSCELAARGGYLVTTCAGSYNTAAFNLVATTYNSNTTCSGTVTSVLALASGCLPSSTGGYFLTTCGPSGYDFHLYSDAACTIVTQHQSGALGCSEGTIYECGSSAASAVTASLLSVAIALLVLVSL